jgi:phosphoglycerate dehydrogenase-like enzyme
VETQPLMRVLVAIYGDVAAWCIPEQEVDALRRAFPGHEFVRADTDDETLARVADADAAFSSRITAAHFGAASRLQWIHSPAAGIGSMLFPAIVNSPVLLTNSRGISARAIAEHAIGVTLALFRKLPLAFDRQRTRTWAQNELFVEGRSIRTLRGARVLLVGLGAIGSDAARVFSAFGAHVTAIRRRVTEPSPAGVAAVLPPERLRDALPAADIVVIAVPQTAATMRLIGAEELAVMKADAVLVNVSRGKLVDEAALVRALETGRLRGVALDVFEHEPLSPDSPLWGREDVIVTPHVAGFYETYWPDARALFADNLRRFIAGEPLRNAVDKTAGY